MRQADSGRESVAEVRETGTGTETESFGFTAGRKTANLNGDKTAAWQFDKELEGTADSRWPRPGKEGAANPVCVKAVAMAMWKKLGRLPR